MTEEKLTPEEIAKRNADFRAMQAQIDAMTDEQLREAYVEAVTEGLQDYIQAIEQKARVRCIELYLPAGVGIDSEEPDDAPQAPSDT